MYLQNYVDCFTKISQRPAAAAYILFMRSNGMQMTGWEARPILSELQIGATALIHCHCPFLGISARHISYSFILSPPSGLCFHIFLNLLPFSLSSHISYLLLLPLSRGPALICPFYSY